MRNYLKVTYSEKTHPLTDYPAKLAKFLFDSYKFKKKLKLLEVGCGRGDVMKNFQELGLECFGVDLSQEAKVLNSGIEVRICDLEKEKLPFKSNFFDVVYSKSFIEHLNNPENFFKEATRVLKPNGLLIILAPDWETQHRTFFDDYTHRTPYTCFTLKDLYEMFNYQEVMVNKFRQLPIAWKYPMINIFCQIIAPFISFRTTNKFLKWSRELMVIGSGRKLLSRKRGSNWDKN